MSWSWKLCRLAGIPVYIHWTFVILLAWIVMDSWIRSNDLITGLRGGAFILALFTCVVLHELGHALTARRFGIKTSDITLLPIGGVARLQRMPDRPVQELLVALAGPAVNVVIVAILYLIFGIQLPSSDGNVDHFMNEPMSTKLLEVNLMLAGFNLLPAFPMDGGRVLRALLAMRMPYARATRTAASIGQMTAIGFALLGMFSNPFLLLIALFVWIGAEAEAAQVEERVALKDVPVRQAMLTEYHTLLPDDTLGRAADLLLSGTQHDFPIIADSSNGMSGLLTRSDLMAGLARAGREARVSDFAKTEIPSVEAGSPLAAAVTRLREGHGPCLQVIDEGRTVGLLTLENIGEFLMVRAALADLQELPPDVGRRMIQSRL
jgi:Zn-dependent protease